MSILLAWWSPLFFSGQQLSSGAPHSTPANHSALLAAGFGAITAV